MTHRPSGWIRLSAALAVLMAGCGDDDPSGPQESELTQAEAMAVFGEVVSAVFVAWASAGQSVEAPEGLTAAPQTFTIDVSAPCDGGGSIELTGTYVSDLDESFSGSYSYDIVETPDDCGVTTGTGNDYVVNGNPNLQFAGSTSFADGSPTGTFDMSFTGGLSWTATGGGGASGSCTINLSYLFDWETNTGSVQGTMCGYSFDQTY